ncbi:MAG: hypothetical protein IT356_03135 [Gemmatimonadaceae bacterium]|nr:hypothetical protein [Gemmatimonadaceae bacterium]
MRDSRGARELAPDLFDTGTERLPRSGQLGALTLAGAALFLTEVLVAPLVLAISLTGSVFAWWLLSQPWSGRRRVSRHRGINSRLLYLSTLMLVGMWLTVMFVFRASDPTLSAGFTTTLPLQVFGLDFSLLKALNGMEAPRTSTAPVIPPPSSIAPFSLFVHGVASTVSTSLLAHVIATARRRFRRRARAEKMVREQASARSSAGSA